MLGVASSGPSSFSDWRLKLGREGVLLSRNVAEEKRHNLDGAEEEDEEHQVDLQFHTITKVSEFVARFKALVTLGTLIGYLI